MTERLRDVECPQCKRTFALHWHSRGSRWLEGRVWKQSSDYEPETVLIASCPSGGIYNVSLSCPHCDYEEEI